MLPDAKLDILLARHAALEAELLGQLGAEAYVRATRELAEITPVVEAVKAYRAGASEIADLEAMIADPATETDMRAMAETDRPALLERQTELEQENRIALLTKDAMDERNVELEVSAGTGDNEIVAVVQGRGAFAKRNFESGVHRVQRVPDTEASVRIHTSAATVAVLPEAEDVDIDIKDTDLRIETMRAQGAGGQHVNKTESAIRITHIPTGIVVMMQDSRSQHKNRASAMNILRSRVLDGERQRAAAERSADRRGQVGSGDRSERIRTYNFPQGRVTDHRIYLTLYKLPQVIAGEALGELVDALTTEHQAAQLAAQGAAACPLALPASRSG